MYCPFCNHPDTKVIDSRPAGEGRHVRRRRECLACAERFTTFEAPELVMPHVIKRDDRREPFDATKLRNGMINALSKRPVSSDQVEAALERIAQGLILALCAAALAAALVKAQDVFSSSSCRSIYDRKVREVNAEHIRRAKNCGGDSGCITAANAWKAGELKKAGDALYVCQQPPDVATPNTPGTRPEDPNTPAPGVPDVPGPTTPCETTHAASWRKDARRR